MDGKIIWAGSSDGLVHVTTDGGAQWQAVRPPTLPKWSDISSIEPAHTDKGTAYLAASRYMWDDFAPYVFKTTDYGKHWTAITDGLPADQYVFDVRQDPGDAKLLFLSAKNTVYVSLDGGAHWQPLTLNLPHVQVRGVAINTREGEIAIATHGRAFWVLDNLTLLEQLTGEPGVADNAAALFAPQQAWLTHAYGKPEHPRQAKGAGKNPPFGASVFFHVPKDYAGKTSVTLAFANAQGETIRSFTLHLKQKSKKKIDTSRMTPHQKQALAERKLTAIEPGMNRFQWNLRYPDATKVKGYYPPEAAGGLAPSAAGPHVLPGSYRVVLDYAGHKSAQTFKVALDPRIKASQADVQASLDLQLEIHHALDKLDKDLNTAMGARDHLQSALADHGAPTAPGRKALADLNGEIAVLVQMDVHSSEGDLRAPPRLHGLLAYLQSDIGMAWAKPTPVQYAVYQQLAQETQAGESKLESAVTAAHAALRKP